MLEPQAWPPVRPVGSEWLSVRPHQVGAQTERAAAAAPKDRLESSGASDPGSEHQQQLDHIGIHAQARALVWFDASTGLSENIISIRALISAVLIAARGETYVDIAVDFDADMCGTPVCSCRIRMSQSVPVDG